MTTKIDAILYSYKNKNLKLVVDTLLENTDSDIFVYVFDQHPIDRSASFSDPRISYEHIFWDTIQSPSERKGHIVNISDADYILELSDDCLVSPNWDSEVVNFVRGEQRIVSGNRKVSIINDDKFFLSKEYSDNDQFSLSNYIDRDFIFATVDIWNSITYPYYLKYNGEEEMMSLDFFRSGKDIYAGPDRLYKNLAVRTLDNLYVPFSKDHAYNRVVDSMTTDEQNENRMFPRTRKEFFAFHGIEDLKLNRLPYSTDDVSYNPYGLSFQDIDARKFISNTKAIY